LNFEVHLSEEEDSGSSF